MKKKILLSMLGLLLAVSLAACAAPAPAPVKPIELKFAGIHPATHMATKVYDEWNAEVEKRTQGKVHITSYPGQTLLTGLEMADGVLEGVADMGCLVPFYARGRFPLIRGMEQPLGFHTCEAANKVGWELFKTFQPFQKEWDEFKVLYYHTASPRQLLSKRPVRTLEDFQGMVCGAGGVERIVELLGASPVSAVIMENYDQLDKGIIDATLVGGCAVKAFRFYEVTGYTTWLDMTQTSFTIIMNLDVWNSLPSDVQKTMDEVSEEWVPYIGKEWDNLWKESTEFSKSQGQEVIYLSPEELARWYDRVEPVIDEWLAETESKGLPGKEFLDEILRLKGE